MRQLTWHSTPSGLTREIPYQVDQVPRRDHNLSRETQAGIPISGCISPPEWLVSSWYPSGKEETQPSIPVLCLQVRLIEVKRSPTLGS